MILTKGNACFVAGRVGGGVGGYEPSVGGKLVHHWRAFKGAILSEINNVVDRKKPLSKGYNPKELVSQSHLHFQA